MWRIWGLLQKCGRDDVTMPTLLFFLNFEYNLRQIKALHGFHYHHILVFMLNLILIITHTSPVEKYILLLTHTYQLKKVH